VFTGNVAGGVGGVAGNGVFGNGGAIDNEGPGAIMTLSHSTLGHNQSGESGNGGAGLGGGLFTYAARTTTRVDRTISDNQAVAGPGEYANGGGIVNSGSAILTLIDSAVVGNLSLGGAGATGNQATGMVGEGIGGGIMNAATMTLVGSTVADNQA